MEDLFKGAHFGAGLKKTLQSFLDVSTGCICRVSAARNIQFRHVGNKNLPFFEDVNRENEFPAS